MLNTTGVPCAKFKKYRSELAAWNAFRRALINNQVWVIPHKRDIEISDSKEGKIFADMEEDGSI